MKVLICGGRDWVDRQFMFNWLDRYQLLQNSRFTLIIHGGARGTDSMAGEYGQHRGIPVQVFRADWATHGRAAGPIRNSQMLLEKPDLVVRFFGGIGSDDMVRKAIAAGVPVRGFR